MALRILCLHGVNTNENGDWFAKWQDSIRTATGGPNANALYDFHELRYNPRFEQTTATPAVYAEAVTRLWNSYWSHNKSLGRPADKGLVSLIDNTIGMVAKWTAVDALRQSLRDDLAARIQAVDPHIVCAHSLGSLIAYDLLSGQQALAKDRLFITLGSQIGHPGVRDSFGGYLKPITTVKHWYHLFNAEDDVLTCELDFPQAPFTQLDTFFDEWGPLDHTAETYLGHRAAAANIWQTFAQGQVRALDAALPQAAAIAPAEAQTLASAKAKSRIKPKAAPAVSANWFKAPAIVLKTSRKRRALLIGINEYPDPKNRLSGCVNDVFLVSALLQERGYHPDEIRVVLDERATTEGIKQRLQWLLGDVRDGDERVLFYSGHGAQITAYDANGEPDHKDETLVTHDFDWTHNFGITDDVLARYYANLPYGARLSIILDCCNSGGMARAGGMTVRGINPPDDIRHRSIAWDKEHQMWFSRANLSLKNKMEKPKPEDVRRYLGDDGATQKMGRAVGLWGDDPKAFRANCQRLGHFGPYNPIILAACREDQFAYEYTHGSVSYGAMTFMLAQQLRASAGNKALEEVAKQCNQILKSKLRFEQEVQLYRPRGHTQTKFAGLAANTPKPLPKPA